MTSVTEDMRPLRLGTRGSALAMTQSGLVADALRALGVPVELVTVRTLGDDRPPDTTWGEGAFVGALESALLSGEVDFAVHSAKDVPTTEDPRLVIAAYPLRDDPRDALVGREPGLTIDSLPTGSRVGTDSPRRTAFLRARRPDVRFHPLHGNVDTRLRRLDTGETDALVLAVAGLNRLHRESRIGQVLAPDVVPPAPGQGALAVQCRADDDATRAWLARLDDRDTRAAVETERAFLHASGGGCRAPIGGLARVEGEEIVLVAGSAGFDVSDSAGPDGGSANGDGASRDRDGDSTAADGRSPQLAWGTIRGSIADRVALAARLAARLNGELADRLPVVGRAGSPRVLVTRAAEQAGPLVAALRAAGLAVHAIPTISVEPVEVGGPLDQAAANLAGYDWVVVTSANGARAIADAMARAGSDPSAARWAAVGTATTAALSERGITVEFVPASASGDAMAEELPVAGGERVLLPRGDLADAHLPNRLRARGAAVDEVVAYRTREGPDEARQPLSELISAGPLDAIVFTSGSTVRGLLALLTPQERRVALRSPVWCIGPSTAAVARECGFGRVTESPVASVPALAALIADALLPATGIDALPSNAPDSDRRDDEPARDPHPLLVPAASEESR